MDWPSVGVVVPTRGGDRPLRPTLDAIEAQDYPGRLRTIVVYDGAPADWMLAHGGERPRMVLANWRSPGLAGARNTGAAALDTDLVAFCDDVDSWLPGKLTAQVTALAEEPGAEFATTAIEVAYQRRVAVRRLGAARVGPGALLRARPAALHPSTFLIRRAALLGDLGMYAEDAPGTQNEAWDLLLRAAERAPLVHVDTPLVRVRWPHHDNAGHGYDARITSLRWMMGRHPEIVAYRPGAARVYGKLACWSAASGQRSQAWRYARAAARLNWREPRVAIAAAAASRLVRVESILELLQRHGRGI
ncbi:MAG TPA: glycosyltransferase family A protein [Rugosimonospora sp.]|nr:glycosyltransferase family A protein [Rugosimonospora sp.]